MALRAARPIRSYGYFPGIPTLVVEFVLVLLHRLLVVGVYALHAFGTLVKGDPVVIVENGQIDRRNMRLNYISRDDLEEAMLLEANTDDLSKIQVARLERRGDISFIKAQ